MRFVDMLLIGYRVCEWSSQSDFKYWTKRFGFFCTLISLTKASNHVMSSLHRQLCLNNKRNGILYPLYYNPSK